MFFIRTGLKTAVAPLRGRGLKHPQHACCVRLRGRSLTGAWIETRNQGGILILYSGRSLTGAWIETMDGDPHFRDTDSRSLTGAWIETDRVWSEHGLEAVAPLRGRGLKQIDELLLMGKASRSLTGAWIETVFINQFNENKSVAPLRGRGLKHSDRTKNGNTVAVAPLRGRGLKR